MPATIQKIMIGKKTYTIALNRSKKTYTIRVYEGGKLVGKYRSNPQGREFSESWTEADIYNFLRYSGDYYSI